jgi:phage-related protein
VSQNKIGDFYLRRGAPGDADRALAAYHASLDTLEALARDNPGDALARRDLSVSQNKIGDFYLRRGAPGDADRALAAYQASLETREALARDNPDDARARRDLSVSQERIGDFYDQRCAPGDADRALAAYQASLDTREALARDNPGDALALWDLVVSLVKLGQLAGARDDTNAAVGFFGKAQQILETMDTEGREMDAQMRGLLEALRKMFGQGGDDADG